MLRWYRSWPATVPEGRAYVCDHLPRLVMTGFDYATAGLPGDEPGFCLLEWDVALDQVGRERFAATALQLPSRVLVAPYSIYPVAGRPAGAHRVMGRPILPGTPSAETFGLGCAYLPQAVLARWYATGPRSFTDRTFSRWYHRTHGPAAVTWEVSPQHLHGD